MNNFQRDGSAGNPQVGRAFEERACKVLAAHGLRLQSPHKVPCGLDTVQKSRAFDLGSENPKVIVECKSHTWTSGGNVPGAKMKNWVDAMFYFHLAPWITGRYFSSSEACVPAYRLREPPEPNAVRV